MKIEMLNNPVIRVWFELTLSQAQSVKDIFGNASKSKIRRLVLETAEKDLTDEEVINRVDFLDSIVTLLYDSLK
jgi:hypothetical protein